MRTIYLSALLIVLHLQSFGQTDQQKYNIEKSRYIQKMDSIFEELDKSQISTGILYDRIPSFANIEKFNKKSDTANFGLFRQAWSELYRASYTPDFINLPEKINSLKKKEDYDEVRLGLINMEYNTINKGSGQQEKGFQMRNGKLAPVEGKDLYKKQTLIMLAPLKERVWGQNITFKFDEDFWLQKTGRTIENLSADFGNGNWQTLIKGGQKIQSEFSINYKESGSQLLRFQVTMQNGAQFTTQSTINVQQTSSARADPLVEDNTIEANIAFKGYNESVAIKGKNEYRTFYRTADGNTTPSLQKPIIILDGFDPLDERKIEREDSGHDPEQLSIRELMRYGTNNNLVTDLRSEGFDVIIVNHSSYEADETGETIVAGGDFIERNARVLIALIQRVNEELERNGSTEDLVVVGPSMGGLISRYALAYMEKHNMDHNTRLWVSFDSPHLGANVPIAISQALHFFAYTGGQEKAKESFEEKLSSNAAKQMLIEQYGALNNTANFRQQFINELESNGLAGSNGFPVNLRKVSLLNGTTLGKGNNSIGAKFIDLKGEKYRIKVAEVMTNFMRGHKTKIRTFKGVVTDYSLWLPALSLDKTEVETSNANPNGSMDVTAGAYNNTNEIMYNDFLEGFNDADLKITSDYHLPNHTFIPTVSALALKNANFNWSNALTRNLVCTGETPFDSYYAPANNQQHITPTTENVAWIMQEINGDEQTPIVRLTGDDLVGDELVCDQNTTYSFGNCKLGNGISSWSSSSGLNIVGQNSTSVTLRPYSNSQGNNTVTAHFSDGTSVTKDLWVDAPEQTLTGLAINPDLFVEYTSSVPFCLSEQYTIVAVNNGISPDELEGVSAVEFDVSGGGEIISSNNWTATVRFCSFATNEYIRMRLLNHCGGGAWKTVQVRRKALGSCGLALSCNDPGGGSGGGSDPDDGDGDGDLPIGDLDPILPCDQCTSACFCFENLTISLMNNPSGEDFGFTIQKWQNEASASSNHSTQVIDHVFNVLLYDKNGSKISESKVDLAKISELKIPGKLLKEGYYYINFEKSGRFAQFRVLKK